MIKHNSDSQKRVDSGFVLRKEPKVASFSDGINWFVDGVKLFGKNPFGWIIFSMVCFALFVVMLLSLFSPSLQILYHVLLPVLIGGVMWGAYQLDKTNTFNPLCMFYGFQRFFRRLIVLGVIFTFGLLILNVAMYLIIELFISSFDEFTATLQMYIYGKLSLEQALEFYKLVLVLAFIFMVISIPVFMGLWFAPALVIINEFSPFHAVKLSFMACLRNTASFFSYGLVCFVLIVIALIPMGFGMLVAVPVLFTSIYTSYKDIFIDETVGVDSSDEQGTSKKTSIEL